MAGIPVVIASPLGDEVIPKLQAVSPRLEIRKAEELVRNEIRLARGSPGSPEHARAIGALDAVLHDAEVMLSGFRLPENVPARTPKLRWVQAMAAGVERFLTSGIIEAGVTLTNAKGIAATPIAEWVLGAMLMFSKRMPAHFVRKAQHDYQRADVLPFSLEGKTVGVLGLGAIGGEIARLSKAVGMTVLATRKNPSGNLPPCVDALFGPEGTRDLLTKSDFVAVALPLTGETRAFIGEAELEAMHPASYLMNVGRGPIIDEAALVRALQDSKIAGAALDVFEKEPLPPNSPLWDLENVIYSPHISGEVDDYDDRVVSLFSRNLARYVNGETLLNVVDRDKGY